MMTVVSGLPSFLRRLLWESGTALQGDDQLWCRTASCAAFNLDLKFVPDQRIIAHFWGQRETNRQVQKFQYHL